jgi:hypothetical protein
MASRRLYLIPERMYLVKEDFARQRILASLLSGLRAPVVSAYTRAKDSFTAVRCPTRSLSQISQPQTSRHGGFFMHATDLLKQNRNLHSLRMPQKTKKDRILSNFIKT